MLCIAYSGVHGIGAVSGGSASTHVLDCDHASSPLRFLSKRCIVTVVLLPHSGPPEQRVPTKTWPVNSSS